MSTLFSPTTIGGVTFSNRVWVAPMCQYSAVEGLMQDWHAVHYGAFITGGAGLVMVEATAVRPEGRITPACLGIWTDQQAQVLAEIPRFAHRHNTKVGIQLAHAGRKGSAGVPWAGGKTVSHDGGGWVTEAPSAVPYADMAVPHEMSLSEIALLKADFLNAAERAVAAGFDVIEIHAAHGYLLHEFISPITNKRTDEYGGSLENRMRLLVEIVTDIRLAVPNTRALFVRISATDWVDGGHDLNDSVIIARELQARGVDLIDVSSGGLDPDQQIVLGPGYQVNFARAIQQEVGIPTSAVGLITSGPQAEEILHDGAVEAVMIGRAMLGNPRWAFQAAADLGEEIPFPHQYMRGFVERR